MQKGEIKKMRKAGILLHISSLPSDYGIGTFGKEAYFFVDFLKKSKQSYWQILPIGPTSYGDSPYQSFSSNAINPYFIDFEILINQGLLKEEEIYENKIFLKVDYGFLYANRFKVLKKAFLRFNHLDAGYQKFLNENKAWVYDYALFMAIKKKYDDVSFSFWPIEIILRKKDVILKLEEELKEEIKFQLFMQYTAYQQFFNLKKYANENGIKLIGDIPIYVAYDSSDVWVNPELFQVDSNLKLKYVAGVPPDNFSKEGQLWGNPLYEWENHKKDNYSWWIEKIKHQSNLFDMIRIDHFIGFENYYSVAASEKNAINGKWKKGPGIDLFNKLKEKLGKLNIIAEDLGVITDDVRKLLKESGFPGMKLLHNGFYSAQENDYTPYTYEKNTIAYTGTHDNPTTKEWFENLNEKELKYCLNYINCQDYEKRIESLIKKTHETKSMLAIIPMQDYLELGSDARMNIPATIGGNWVWRLKKDDIKDELIEKIANWTKLYGRC